MTHVIACWSKFLFDISKLSILHIIKKWKQETCTHMSSECTERTFNHSK